MENKSIISTIMTAFVTGMISIIVFYAKERIKKKQEYEKNINLCLIDHPFFVRTEMLKSNMHNTFVLNNKGKEIVFKDIIYNLINVFQIVLSSLVEKIDKNKINDSTELYNNNIEALNKIIESHNNYYKINPMYTQEEQEVLDIVMRKFDVWNKERMEFVQQQIMSICNSSYYKTPKVKEAVVLDLYLWTSICIIDDAVRTLNNINGELRGRVFRNTQI